MRPGPARTDLHGVFVLRADDDEPRATNLRRSLRHAGLVRELVLEDLVLVLQLLEARVVLARGTCAVMYPLEPGDLAPCKVPPVHTGLCQNLTLYESLRWQLHHLFEMRHRC